MEGWHHRLNSHAGKTHLPFYVITTVLKEEAEDVDRTLKLVSNRKIKRFQRKSYRTLQVRLHNCWYRYSNGDVTNAAACRMFIFCALLIFKSCFVSLYIVSSYLEVFMTYTCNYYFYIKSLYFYYFNTLYYYTMSSKLVLQYS